MAGEGQYLAYLVRLWTVSQDGGVVWRVSAEDAHTGERRGFADLASLHAFLQEATAAQSGQARDESNAAVPDHTQDVPESR